MQVQCTFLSDTDFTEFDGQRRAGNTNYQPGMMWYCPWLHDPNDPEDRESVADTIKAISNGQNDPLSIYYYRDWAFIRPPIMVVTPSCALWCVDQKSTNGNGWHVTGTVPNITCSPSIVVPGYHGFLRDGLFSDPI